MHPYARVTILLAGVLLTASCSDTDARLFATQPSLVDTSSVVVSATSSTAFAQPVSEAFCPSIAPFNVPIGVIVRATGSSVVVVTGIRLLFTDTSGRQAPQVTLPMLPLTLPAPGPTVQFGDVLESRSARTFPLNLGIGCGTGRRGTVVIIVDTSDGRGRHRSERLEVAVR